MRINKFQFLIVLTAVQLLAASGFAHERPDRFAQDLGGNSVCSPANLRDPNSRCPMRVSTITPAPRVNASAPAAAKNTEIPAPSNERAPSALSQ